MYKFKDFAFNGLGNAAGLWYTSKKRPGAGEVDIIFGVVMMVWIAAQVSWIGYRRYLQSLFFATGLAQVIFGILFIKALKIKSGTSE